MAHPLPCPCLGPGTSKLVGMSSRRPSGKSGPQGSDSRSRPRKESASSAARRRAVNGTKKGPDKPTPSKPTPSKSTPSKSTPRGECAQQTGRPTGKQRTPTQPGNQRARQTRPPASERFNKKLNIRFSSGEKTRQFSLRTLAVLFFAVIGIVLVASPLNQYLDQQQEKRELLQQLHDTTARVELLEQEIARWQDDDFVRSQARERLGYVMPGETLYLVSDPDEGTPEELLAQRTQEVNDRRRQATPFYATMWDSVVIAGGVGEVENPSNVPLIEPTDDVEPTDDEPTSETVE